jgi:hypothetical protein
MKKRKENKRFRFYLSNVPALDGSATGPLHSPTFNEAVQVQEGVLASAHVHTRHHGRN